MVVHDYNSNYLGTKQEDFEFQANLGNTARRGLKNSNYFNSQIKNQALQCTSRKKMRVNKEAMINTPNRVLSELIFNNKKICQMSI